MSAILSADDLNDFISPGVACIKPIETLPTTVPAPSSSASLEHEVILDGHASATNTASSNAPPAQISLTDCLACSGCVTSAEAVLISLQSHYEVLHMLDSAPALQVHGPAADGGYSVTGLENPDAKLFVASVSPQTRANLAAACGDGTTEKEAGYMLEQLLRGDEGLRAGGKWQNGFEWVIDTNTARDATLVLGADEVREAVTAPTKPIITSSCPGWVCYAEKTHPHVLPHLSKVKSPQALVGTMLKTTLSRQLGIAPDRIWHLAVMPCFDKKLEASREELTDSIWNGSGSPGRGIRDVDCVVTSKEILMLVVSRGIDIFQLPRTALSPPRRLPDPRINDFLVPSRKRKRPHTDAGTSGGNLQFVLQDQVSKHTGSSIQTIKGKNADVVEYSVLSAQGEPVFQAARYYGFHNIQNLVRKLKPPQPSRMPGGRPFGAARRPAGKPKIEYGYVEVMACPGGCTNGGGQIKIDDAIMLERSGLGNKADLQAQRAWLAQVDEAYFSADESDAEKDALGGSADGEPDEVLIDGISPEYVRGVLAYWADLIGVDQAKLTHTSFREVISDVGKDISDTARVVQLAGKIGGGW